MVEVLSVQGIPATRGILGADHNGDIQVEADDIETLLGVDVFALPAIGMWTRLIPVV
jgi:hypothetical protein